MTRRDRGESLLSVVFALSLTTVLAAAFADRIASQARELRFAREEARARAALRETAERLRAGLVDVPAPGAVVRVQVPPLTVELARVEAEGPALPDTVVPVRLRVTWSAPDGPPRARELFTVARRPGAR